MLGGGAAVGDVGAAGTLWDCRHCSHVRASRSAPPCRPLVLGARSRCAARAAGGSAGPVKQRRGHDAARMRAARLHAAGWPRLQHYLLEGW